MTEDIKYVGIIKWFGDRSRDANYGFIEVLLLGDLFFHQRSVAPGQDVSSFRENTVVVFSIRDSHKYQNRKEAVEVKCLSSELNLDFVFDQYLKIVVGNSPLSANKHIVNAVQTTCAELFGRLDNESKREELSVWFMYAIQESIDTSVNLEAKQVKRILEATKKFFPANYETLVSRLESKFGHRAILQLWIDGIVDKFPVQYIAGRFINTPSHDFSLIIRKMGEDEKRLLVDSIHDELERLIESGNDLRLVHNEDEIIRFLKLIQKLNSEYKGIEELLLGVIPDSLAHRLWLLGLLATCQINYISANLTSFGAERKDILNRCTEQQRHEIFQKILHSFNRFDIEQKLAIKKEVLEYYRHTNCESYDEVLNVIVEGSADHIRLDLWLADFYDVLDFNSYKIYTATLSMSDQRKFVKKVLRNIHEGKADISVDDFLSINVMDYNTSQQIRQASGARFDFSTSIILHVISELNKQTKLEDRKSVNTAQYKIYDLILRQIKSPEDVLEITGYFDECGGRYRISVNEIKNDNQEVVDRKISFHRYEKAKNHPICDGRLAPKLSPEGLKYWWCANQKCYQTSREVHQPSDWEKYTILDFLTILKITYDEAGFEIYLNVINKVNRFLKHMKCRECNCILHPRKKSSYAFYGVNLFTCKNTGCSKSNEDIYLSHCSNGFCEMVIDSRDSVKCIPEGYDQKCGWYVCNYCYACCNTTQLNLSKYKYENVMHKEYTCHTVGHRDMGVISCNNCGHGMQPKNYDLNEYERILKWFVDNKDRVSVIQKSGEHQGKKWFLLKRGQDSEVIFQEKLRRYQMLGFRIPNIEITKEFQLISEANDEKEIYVCSNCHNMLDLSTDLERAKAIKKYHNVVIKPVRQNPNTL